jgi:hypothetical protein
MMMIGLWLSAWGVAHAPMQHGPDRFAWIVVLLIQSVPYASTVLASFASAFPLPASVLGLGYRARPGAAAVPRPRRA